MKIIQPPKPIEEMTTQEKEDWEDLLEEYAELHPIDAYDTLEEIRKLLNSSKIEAMHMIKKNSRFGNQCPYYLKAKILFARDNAVELFTLLDKFREELEQEDLYDQFKKRG